MQINSEFWQVLSRILDYSYGFEISGASSQAIELLPYQLSAKSGNACLTWSRLKDLPSPPLESKWQNTRCAGLHLPWDKAEELIIWMLHPAVMWTRQACCWVIRKPRAPEPLVQTGGNRWNLNFGVCVRRCVLGTYLSTADTRGLLLQPNFLNHQSGWRQWRWRRIRSCIRTELWWARI